MNNDNSRTFTTCNGIIQSNGFCDTCNQRAYTTSIHCGRLIEATESTTKQGVNVDEEIYTAFKLPSELVRQSNTLIDLLRDLELMLDQVDPPPTIKNLKWKVSQCLDVVGLEDQKQEGKLYDQLKNWLIGIGAGGITKNDGQYFAINNGKRFIAYNCDLKFGKTWFGIREDGDTRTVFNGTVETLEDAKRIWTLTDPTR